MVEYVLRLYCDVCYGSDIFDDEVGYLFKLSKISIDKCIEDAKSKGWLITLSDSKYTYSNREFQIICPTCAFKANGKI